MAIQTPVEIDEQRVAALTAEELARLNESTPRSAEMFERARRTLSAGVASSYQLRDPWPIYLERGDGPVVWDVDGNRMLDFHNGFGSMVQGHGNPAITRAVASRIVPTRCTAPRSSTNPRGSVNSTSVCMCDQALAGGAMMIEEMILTILLLGWLFYRFAQRDEQRQALMDLATQRGVELSDDRAARAAAAGASDRLRERLLAVGAKTSGSTSESPEPPGERDP